MGEETGQQWGHRAEKDEPGSSGRQKGKPRSNVCRAGMNHSPPPAARAQKAASAGLSQAPVICSFQSGMAGPGVLLLLESARGTGPSTEQVAWLVMGPVVLQDLHHLSPYRASCRLPPAPPPALGTRPQLPIIPCRKGWRTSPHPTPPKRLALRGFQERDPGGSRPWIWEVRVDVSLPRTLISMDHFVQKKPKPNKRKGNRPASSTKHLDPAYVQACICVCVCMCVHTQHRCVSQELTL